jgi:hypothetical protein
MNSVFQNLRVGHSYQLVNHGEKTEFTVLKKIAEDNFFVKNNLTLESFELFDLVRFGIGKDFLIRRTNE